MKCHYCPKTTDLRPYGPKGAMVCFDCAMGTPDRKAETERNFSMQLEAAGPVPVIGTEAGPFPLQHLVGVSGNGHQGLSPNPSACDAIRKEAGE